MLNILIDHIYFGKTFYLCGTYTKFYHHLGNKNAGFLSTFSSGGPVMIYGPISCNRSDLITFVIVDSIPIAVCIKSIIESVKRPCCQYLCHQIKLHPIVYFYYYVMQCPTVFAHVQCNLPFLPPMCSIFLKILEITLV